MSPKEIFTHLSLSYIYTCGSGSVFGIRIRIHIALEYGSKTDPDPQQSTS